MTNYRKFYAYDPVTGQQIDVVPYADVRRQEQDQAEADRQAKVRAVVEARQAKEEQEWAQKMSDLAARHEQQLREGKLFAYDPSTKTWMRMQAPPSTHQLDFPPKS